MYHHGLAEHPVMEETIKLMFTTMSEFRLGKSSTLFNKMASELGHLVLTNKKDQTTRFIRSAARAVKTFLQNLPTLVMVQNSIYEEHVREKQNTKAKEILEKLKKLGDPRFLLRLVGLGQIMETYRKVSLEGQYSDHLPSEVWDSVVQNRAELELLADRWTWGHKDLKFLDVEAPEIIVERLTEKDVYRPKVFFKNVIRKGAELKEAGLLVEGQKVSSLFEDEEMVLPLAGEIPMEVPGGAKRTRRNFLDRSFDEVEREDQERNFSQVDLKKVEKTLSGLCRSIVDEWNARMIQSPLAVATCEVLGKPMQVEEDMNNYVAKMRTSLGSLLAQLPGHLQERYEVANLLDGYSTFMEVFRNLQDEFQVNQIYFQWYKKHVKTGDSEESSTVFADFFECVQVRSSSEAFCETIGSVMNNHSGKGRYLRPINFNKEIFLEINLGPTFLSEKLVREVYELRKKDYLYKEDMAGRLVTSFSKLADGRFGAAIRTFRKGQQEKSRFPAVFWE